jgi:hypothetical protein
MIAVAGVDMAAWDALAKAAGVPLCMLLGGSIGPAPAYNSNGLWLRSRAELMVTPGLRDEGRFPGSQPGVAVRRLADDIATPPTGRFAANTVESERSRPKAKPSRILGLTQTQSLAWQGRDGRPYPERRRRRGVAEQRRAFGRPLFMRFRTG